MDCTDIVAGAAQGYYHRIRDYYARGRHTPSLDETWGGQDDITGATGWEKDGVTTLIFRRKILPKNATTAGDHSLLGQLLLIWSRGQEPTERENQFYVRDELKYHGTGNGQRGSIVINFGEKSSRIPGINALVFQK